jgi:hypothetical protein
MFAISLAAVIPLLLFAAARASVAAHEQRPVTALLVAGYVARLAIQVFSRELTIFSTEGADWLTYQINGELIARLWTYNGIHYVTTNELPSLNRVTLPANLFGFIFYLNGEPTRLGGTAVIALLACLTCLNVYTIALELGAPRSAAIKMMAFLLFMPTFLFYTSDMFKEAIVYFGVVLVLGSSLRLAAKFSVRQLVVGLLGLACVGLTRYYMAYVLSIPLLIGWLGARSGSWLRGLVAILILAVLVGSVVSYTSMAGNAAEDASGAFEQGTSRLTVQANVDAGGSGVSFDDGGSPFGSLPAKLLYTLFSPFPWQSGSLGLQLAKLEVLAWYFLAYRVLRASKVLWRQRRNDLIIVLSFIIPTTLAYAISFSNIGLNSRERLGVVIASALLATVSWRVPAKNPEDPVAGVATAAPS